MFLFCEVLCIQGISYIVVLFDFVIELKLNVNI